MPCVSTPWYYILEHEYYWSNIHERMREWFEFWWNESNVSKWLDLCWNLVETPCSWWPYGVSHIVNLCLIECGWLYTCETMSDWVTPRFHYSFGNCWRSSHTIQSSFYTILFYIANEHNSGVVVVVVVVVASHRSCLNRTLQMLCHPSYNNPIDSPRIAHRQKRLGIHF